MSREKASEAMGFVSPERIEKIESEKSLPHPDEVLAMSKCYKK
ncbi:MAG: helix-turn-helix transcriptional regulator, partial [Lachnospiraceae bacterium]|nr:helix-turn-helix transcriptional regulator [Lachnospiraceae bacterium]